MDVAFLIKRRLEEFGLEQRDLAQAAEVTDSYVSQLLNGKKKPPAPNRTDIYEKMDRFLKLPSGQLAALAGQQRKEELARELGGEPAPLVGEVRALILRKCDPRSRSAVRAIFERHPFGELERLVVGTLVNVVKELAHSELENETWLRTVAELGGRSYQAMRVIVLDFLDADVFHLTGEHCASFLDPLVDSWTIDSTTFAMDVVLTDQVVEGNVKRFEFTQVHRAARDRDPALEEFLADPRLSEGVTAEEVEHLARLTFSGKRPTPLFYYRVFQDLRDPLHFRGADHA